MIPASVKKCELLNKASCFAHLEQIFFFVSCSPATVSQKNCATSDIAYRRHKRYEKRKKKSEQNTGQALRGSEFQVQDQQDFIEEHDIARGGRGGGSQQKIQCGKLEQ